MKIKFKGIKYIYDVDSDKCIVDHPHGVECFENPIEGFNVFTSHLNFLLSQQLKTELEKNSRSRWTGAKEKQED